MAEILDVYACKKMRLIIKMEEFRKKAQQKIDRIQSNINA